MTGPIDGATRDDLGKTIDVTVSGDRAYTRSLRTPIVLLVIGGAIVIFMGVVVPISLRRTQRRLPAPPPAPAKPPVEEVARQIRELRSAGRLADAAVCAAYAEQLMAGDPVAARAAYRRAAELQRAFAASATAGGEGLARMAVAHVYEARAH